MFLIPLVISSLLAAAAVSNAAAKNMTLHVSSTAFSEGQSIPEKYTCDGNGKEGVNGFEEGIW